MGLTPTKLCAMTPQLGGGYTQSPPLPPLPVFALSLHFSGHSGMPAYHPPFLVFLERASGHIPGSLAWGRPVRQGLLALSDPLASGCACAQHNGRPYCHKPCYGALFGPRGVNIGGVGCYIYNLPTPPANSTPLSPSDFSPPRPRTGLPQGKKSPPHMKTFTGETSLCPGCEKPVYFAEKVMSLGRNWHRPCLRCQRCQKTLTAGRHAEHDGIPYCHIPCYGYLFGPKGVNIGDVGCYIYE
ncbi:cysteine-rich protein 3 isoform X1 [Dipodomys spectabilis]|uniref:cysteine-rich protein 3 isoform X1 n=1 Tax=Dipodomys spectabilis TaxID=105255 RepID=UPI001C545609|nr:cysteine-rich protein 3 isoform X1 [Dipodomys spectabilis]